MTTENIKRYRLIYTKRGNLRFTGHLDLQRVWERAFRRSRLPIRYSQGYSPKARLNLASALPLGFISSYEMLDFWMNESLDPEVIKTALQETLPTDLVISNITIVPNNLPSLQGSTCSSEFKVKIPAAITKEEISRKINLLEGASSLMRSKRGKSYDLKSLIESITINQEETPIEICLRMSAQPGATGRPDEVLEALGIDPKECLIERTFIYFDPS